MLTLSLRKKNILKSNVTNPVQCASGYRPPKPNYKIILDRLSVRKTVQRVLIDLNIKPCVLII